MTAFDGLLRDTESQGVGKKQNLGWGTMQLVIQSGRIDRSKNVMDKAMELKEKKNTMGVATKLSGILRSNPFHVLQVDELRSMAGKIGVHIHEDIFGIDALSSNASCIDAPISVNINSVVADLDVDQRDSLETVIYLNDDCPKTPDQCNTDQEFDDRGENVQVYVLRKKRGNHPRKMFR
jgi:hypothetical protein